MSKSPKEPTESEVMRSAILGAGITRKGYPVAKKCWEVLLPMVASLEALWPDDPGEVEGFVRRILGVLVVRKQFAAALRAKRRAGR